MVYAKKHEGSFGMLESGWKSVGHRERWKIVQDCIWWTIWLERNQRFFEKNSCSMENMKLNCLALFYFWCKHGYPHEDEDIPNILEFLMSSKENNTFVFLIASITRISPEYSFVYNTSYLFSKKLPGCSRIGPLSQGVLFQYT